MRSLAGFGRVAVFLFAASATLAQPPPPVADRVETPLVPSGISEFPVQINAELAHRFKDPDGTNAVHFTDDFLLTLGDDEKEELRAKEAVVWIIEAIDSGRPYKHLQVYLYRDAEITQIGGTYTTAPVLFATLSTYADVTIEADEINLQSSVDTQVYQEGNAIRKAIQESGFKSPDPAIALGVLDPAGIGTAKRAPAEKPIIHFETKGEINMMDAGEGRKVMVITGGVYLSRGLPGVNEYFEIQADSAVIYLTPGATATPESGLGGAVESRETGPAGSERATGATARKRRPADRQLLASTFGDIEVEAAYLEGDVQLSQGLNIVRASRLYYDFHHERAVILDAVARSMLVQRNVPLYVRADEIRQLSANEITAENAILTTSEFHTPHYHIGARRVDLINRTQPDPTGQRTGIQAGTFRIYDATFNLGGHPILWWPYMQGDVASSETALKSVRAGYSGHFGAEFETRWHLFNLLGYETPKGFDATLTTEYLTKRGPAAGIDVDYERDRYFGLLKSYIIADEGEDKLGRRREEDNSHDVRGRLLFRHRQYLEDDWQVSLELSYLSDRNFLEQFFEKEFDNDKEQETILYLKKQHDNWAFTAALQTRLMDFLTQTERFPDFSLQLIGEPIGDWGTWYSENRLGVVRYSAADQTFWEFLRNGPMESSHSTFRADTRQEATAPIDLGLIRAVPFAAVRGSYWSDSIDGGSAARGFGETGVRASSYFWKAFPDCKSSLLDMDGLRHVIKPDVTAWVSGASKDRDDLFRFDETVEGIQDISGITLGLRQRWQTRRGIGENRRIVDVFTNDLEFGAFSNTDDSATSNGYASFSRPENSIARNYVSSATTWRVNDRTALINEINYDLNDGEIDVLNLSLAVERSPRFSYLIGYRFIEDSDSNLLGLDMNYKMTEKYAMAVRELFDLERGRTLEFTLAFIRKFPRWYGALAFDLDNSKDDYGVSVSIWPEGLPQSGLGSRRFTGLARISEFQTP